MLAGLHLAARSVLIVVAAFYGYGALVHVANIAGWTGIDWVDAPGKWQVLDVIYLGLDLAVLALLPFRHPAGVAVFYVAALSQILLYTIGRDWIMDVPAAYQRPAEDVAYLDVLVTFHLVTLALVSAALWHLRGR